MPGSMGLSSSGATEMSQRGGRTASRAHTGWWRISQLPCKRRQVWASLQAATLWNHTACCQLSPAQGTPLRDSLLGQDCRRSSDFAAGRGGVKGTAILLMPFTFARVERAY